MERKVKVGVIGCGPRGRGLIKTICACGSKAIVNARLDGNMRVVTDGEQVMLGGNESYIALCHKCWKQKIKQQKEEAHV